MALNVLGIAGFSGNGKTTLIENVLPLLVDGGWRVCVVKHVHHEFDLDSPGRDTWRHRRAGAREVMVASPLRWALLHELGEGAEPGLPALIDRLEPCDLVLVEGFKREPIPKLEVHRTATGTPLLYTTDAHVVAVVSDAPVQTELPVFGLHEYPAIARFIMQYFGLR